MTFRILFVCSGNTCRSPLAEALAEREAGNRGIERVVASSAGAYAIQGQPASAGASKAACARGLDLKAHRSRRLAAGMISAADIVVGMSGDHLAAVRQLREPAAAVLATEGLSAGDVRRGASVPDPFGGDDLRYERTARLLEECVSGLFDWLEETGRLPSGTAR